MAQQSKTYILLEVNSAYMAEQIDINITDISSYFSTLHDLFKEFDSESKLILFLNSISEET